MLTKKQKQILEFVKKYIKKRDYSPSLEEIGKHFKLVKSTIHEHIEILKEKGYLNKEKNKSRAIDVYENEKMVNIPLLGLIAAGQPIEAIQNREMVAIPKSKLPHTGKFYTLRVVGNSMIDENINDGDLILVKQQDTAENGQKVVALMDNYEATLKRFYKEKKFIRLQPANKTHEPIIIKGDRELTIQGIVIDVIKNEEEIQAKNLLIKIPDKKQPITNIETFDDFKKVLGEPYFETKDCLIFNANCLNIMKQINNSCIDLTITSPPYNIGKEYEKIISTEKYVKWSQEWMTEIYRITKEFGSFWLNLGYLEYPNKGKAVPITYLLWDKSPFYLIQEVIWNYSAGVAAKKFLSPRNEKLLWFVRDRDRYTFNLDDIRDKNVKYPNQKKNGKLRCNSLGKNPSDVWQISKVTSGRNRSSKERTKHPAQFPIELINRGIKSSSNKKQIIFDPFLGSGTTIISALKNNRKVIGIETSKDYCEIAKQRILEYLETQKQEKLFAD